MERYPNNEQAGDQHIDNQPDLTNAGTSATHTPGPWALGETLPARFPSYVIKSNAGKIAEVPIMSHGRSNKDAQLIAAAPELLVALQLMVREILPLAHGRRFTAPRRAAVEQARMAIHKARS